MPGRPVYKDEALRFALCRPEPLHRLFKAGLKRVEVAPIEVPTVFRDFDDRRRAFVCDKQQLLAGDAPYET